MFIINKSYKYDNTTKVRDILAFSCGIGFGFPNVDSTKLIMFWEDEVVPQIYDINPDWTLKECVNSKLICDFEDIDFIAFDEEDFKLIFQKNT